MQLKEIAPQKFLSSKIRKVEIWGNSLANEGEMGESQNSSVFFIILTEHTVFMPLLPIVVISIN